MTCEKQLLASKSYFVLAKDSPLSYSVVIVTHNSEKYLSKCIASIDAQSRQPDCIVLSDSGSKSLSYLESFRQHLRVKIQYHTEDIGFCRANNAAMASVNSEYVLFLNPDAFLTQNFCEQALILMQNHQQVGMLSGKLLGYDIDRDQPTGIYDSTGIFRTWYGHWFDRDQGKRERAEDYGSVESVPALCGALLFCRKAALEKVLLRKTEVWDSSFHMYKDDIDLSLRLRKAGWSLLFSPHLTAYHCRGWQTDRRKMLKKYRLMSARNEIRINSRECWLGLPYSLSKYYAVKIFNI